MKNCEKIQIFINKKIPDFWKFCQKTCLWFLENFWKKSFFLKKKLGSESDKDMLYKRCVVLPKKGQNDMLFCYLNDSYSLSKRHVIFSHSREKWHVVHSVYFLMQHEFQTRMTRPLIWKSTWLKKTFLQIPFSLLSNLKLLGISLPYDS